MIDGAHIAAIIVAVGGILGTWATYRIGSRQEEARAEQAAAQAEEQKAERAQQAKAAAQIGVTEATSLAFSGFSGLVETLREQLNEQGTRERDLLTELSNTRHELSLMREERLRAAEREALLVSELRVLRHEVAMLRNALVEAGLDVPELPATAYRRAADLPLSAEPYGDPVPVPVPGVDVPVLRPRRVADLHDGLPTGRHGDGDDGQDRGGDSSTGRAGRAGS